MAKNWYYFSTLLKFTPIVKQKRKKIDWKIDREKYKLRIFVERERERERERGQKVKYRLSIIVVIRSFNVRDLLRSPQSTRVFLVYPCRPSCFAYQIDVTSDVTSGPRSSIRKAKTQLQVSKSRCKCWQLMHFKAFCFTITDKVFLIFFYCDWEVTSFF